MLSFFAILELNVCKLILVICCLCFKFLLLYKTISIWVFFLFSLLSVFSMPTGDVPTVDEFCMLTWQDKKDSACQVIIQIPFFLQEYFL